MLARLVFIILLQQSSLVYAYGSNSYNFSQKINWFHVFCLVAVLICALIMLSTLYRDIQRYRAKSISVMGLVIDLLWTSVPFMLLAALCWAIARTLL